METVKQPSIDGQSSQQVIKLLKAQFAVFRDNLPLAIGIFKQISARMPELDRKALRAALRMHTGSTSYLKAILKSTHRYDLDSAQTEVLDQSHRAHAEQWLKERAKKAAQKRKAQLEAEAEAKRIAEKVQALQDKFSRSK